MPEVSVDAGALKKAKKLCTDAEEEIKNTLSSLNSKVSSLLSEWDDQKAKEFEKIVFECLVSLKQPLNDLQKCDLYLSRLASLVAEYENVSFSAPSPGIELSASSQSGASANPADESGESPIDSNASIEQVLYAVPRNLQQTQYGFEPLMINGQRIFMYNKPLDTARNLIRRQGHNTKEMFGTCGLCQCANLLRLAGITDVTEENVIDIALSCSPNTSEGLDRNNPNPNLRGGTNVASRREILSRFNLPTEVYSISSDRNESVSYLGQQVASGHGVIISVDAGVLWNDPRYLGGGHAVSLISVSESGDTFIYSDTGSGRIGVISENDLGQALTGRPANITSNIIR